MVLKNFEISRGCWRSIGTYLENPELFLTFQWIKTYRYFNRSFLKYFWEYLKIIIVILWMNDIQEMGFALNRAKTDTICSPTFNDCVLQNEKKDYPPRSCWVLHYCAWCLRRFANFCFSAMETSYLPLLIGPIVNIPQKFKLLNNLVQIIFSLFSTFAKVQLIWIWASTKWLCGVYSST